MHVIYSVYRVLQTTKKQHSHTLLEIKSSSEFVYTFEGSVKITDAVFAFDDKIYLF